MIHQAQTYKEREREVSKAKAKADKELKEWEAKAFATQDELVLLQGKYSALENKAKRDEEAIISNYMDSQSFLRFMDSHDDALRPEFLSTGWEKAVNSIGKAHPGMVNPTDFPSPWRAIDHVSGSGARSSSQILGSGSKGAKQASGSGSKGADDIVSSGPPSKGKIRCALPEKGVRNVLSSSSSSSGEMDEGSSEEEESDGEEADEGAGGDGGDQEARTEDGVDSDSD